MLISDWSSDVCSSDLPAPAVCDKVDPLGRPANKYNLAIRSRATELRHPPPRRFISQRHIGRAGVDAAMDRRTVRSSEARRVGQDCVITVRSRWAPDTSKKQRHIQKNLTTLTNH